MAILKRSEVLKLAFDQDGDLYDFAPKNELEPKLWAAGDLKPIVRGRLLEIAEAFKKSLGVDLPFGDVIFTGSLANYNYTKFSDIDLHLLIDLRGMTQQGGLYAGHAALLSEFFTAKGTVWNSRHNIFLEGYEVEMYVQDTGEPHTSSGVYNVTQAKWIVEPSPFHVDIDKPAVEAKARSMMAQIDSALDPACGSECVSAIRAKLRKMRKSGLEDGGEMSIENLAYKVLRRTGYLDKLADAFVRAQDAEYSFA